MHVERILLLVCQWSLEQVRVITVITTITPVPTIARRAIIKKTFTLS